MYTRNTYFHTTVFRMSYPANMYSTLYYLNEEHANLVHFLREKNPHLLREYTRQREMNIPIKNKTNILQRAKRTFVTTCRLMQRFLSVF